MNARANRTLRGSTVCVALLAAGIGLAAVVLAVILLLYYFRDRALKVLAFLLRPLPERARLAALKLVVEFIDGLR